MTVSNTSVSTGPYTANGSTTAFPFSFSAGSTDDLRVYTDGALTTLPYTASIVGGGEGGTVTFDTAPANGTTVLIRSKPAFGQDIAFLNAGPFNAESMDDALDEAARRSIYLLDKFSETVRVPEGEAIAALPPPTDRAGTIFGFSLFTGIREILTYSNLSTLLAPFLTPLLSAINKGDPGGNVMSIGLFLAGPSISVSSGTNIVRTSGYSVDGKGGAFYQYDAAVDAAYVTAHPRSAFISSNGRGFRLSLDQQIKVTMFGAVGGDTANDGAAFVAALAFCFANGITGTGYARKGCPSLNVPLGQYYLGAQPLDLLETIDFFGESSTASGAGAAAQLRWDDGVTGIRTQASDTNGDTATGAQVYGGSQGSRIRNLYLEGGYAGTESEHHGILMRANCDIENVQINNFPGDGVAILTLAGGNANGWTMKRVAVHNCRNGTRAEGANSNIGRADACVWTDNRRWNVIDNSQLGNLWHGISENGGKTVGATPSLVVHSGNWYAVRNGQEAGAATNAPSGTTVDNTWWYYCNAGAVQPYAPAWFNGITVLAGGAALVSRGSGHPQFLNFWTEEFQGPMQLVPPARVDGGAQASGVRGIARMRADGSPRFTVENLAIVKGGAFGPSRDVQPPQPATANSEWFFQNSLDSTIVYFRRWVSLVAAEVDGQILADANGLSLTGSPRLNLLVDPGTGAMTIGKVFEDGIDLNFFSPDTGYYFAGLKVVGARGAAINDPTGGAVIDVECRARLAELLAHFRLWGSIAP